MQSIILVVLICSLGGIAVAISRSTNLLTHGIANQVSGPGTKELLYETVVGVSSIAASGAAFGTGPRSAGGKLDDQFISF